MILHVECDRGAHGSPEPIAFHLGGLRLEVLRIVDRWPSNEYSYFKVEAADASICILRHWHARQEWELTLYQAPGGATGERVCVDLSRN